MGNGKRKKAIRTCRCIISFAIDSMGAADDAGVGDVPVGEGGRAMRSSISEMDSHGAHSQDEEEGSAIDTHQIASLETPGAGGSSWQYRWSKMGNPWPSSGWENNCSSSSASVWTIRAPSHSGLRTAVGSWPGATAARQAPCCRSNH